jgi:hypothetical protein
VDLSLVPFTDMPPKIAPSLQYKAGKLDGYRQAALKFTSAFLVLAVVWCSAGLVALDFAEILPTRLSPLLNFIRLPVHVSTTAALLCIAPVTHMAGTMFVPEYEAFAPLRGGTRFIYLQAGGWCCYSAGLLYVASDLVASIYPNARLVCLGCQSGFLIALAIMMVVGNSLLIASLYHHETHLPAAEVRRIKDSLHQARQREQRDNDDRNTDWSLVVDVFLICSTVAGVLVLGLKHHPGLSSSFGKDAYFVSDDGTVELPFCEQPYLFSSHLGWPLDQVAQLPSAVLHMPFVPVLNLLLYYGCPHYTGIQRGAEQLQVILGLFVFQFWTGIGHVAPNPRKLFIQETSIMLSLVVLRAFANSMTTHERYKIGTVPFLKLLVFMLSSYVCVGLMPTILFTNILVVGCLCLSVNGHQICRPLAGHDGINVPTARTNLKELVKQIMPDLTSVGRITLAVLLLLSIGLLFAEVQLCQLLMRYNAKVSWHAPFDFFFWQGFWTFIQVVALSKPGSLWRRDPLKEKEEAWKVAVKAFRFPLQEGTAWKTD